MNNVKIFKEVKYWPQILGLSATLVGGILMGSNDTMVTGLGVTLAGVALSGVNAYDFVVVGEPNFNN